MDSIDQIQGMALMLASVSSHGVEVEKLLVKKESWQICSSAVIIVCLRPVDGWREANRFATARLKLQHSEKRRRWKQP
jgi:hypothetical protein